MGMLIKELIDPTHLNMLRLNSDPAMIQQENVSQAAIHLIKTIQNIELYPSLKELAQQFEALQKNYPTIYSHRSFFVWQFSQAGYQLTSLNLAPIDFLQSNMLKCQAVFMTVLFDDICDLAKDKALFYKTKLALEGVINQDEIELYKLMGNTWLAFNRAVELTPNHALLKPFLQDAYQKWIDSFEHSLAIQQESFYLECKWKKHLEVISHSTIIYLAGLIDLLFVSNLSTDQIYAASKVFLCTQQMAQLGNWASTWERELKQRDFTSGIFSIALENGWIDWETLKNNSLEIVKQKISDSPAQSHLWREWERLRRESHKIVQEIHLPVLDGYVESSSVIMFMQLASAGLM